MVNKKTCRRRVLAVWGYGLLLSVTVPSSAVGGPDGGQVVGGTGSIASSGAITTINQTSQNMAIDWQNYNVNANERVQYIQPNSSSISLNRILSQSGSTIAGRIDANGQVILVNPNGIFFTSTSIINVGGIIASGLNIQPNDFMNGNYIFDEVLGTNGTVINSGTITASLGGNVALVGKQVKNDGLIVANLGTVNLAAGKQAVLTFDQGGLLGVRVSKEILQDELGVDPAVINSGDIQAESGRVLLTASTSQDVFSQAVNTGGLDQATSAVVHEDGSFTLGGGADVINTGSIDTSTTLSDQNVGRIVLIGENVTSSGELRADAANGRGGEIELHAQDTTLLTGNSITSARSEREGRGGTVKVLGDNVGLFDQSTIDVSGDTGGGQVFIGGDQEGNNALIPNAKFIYLSDESQVFADALDNGDGGRLITFASDTARIYGSLSARGGINGGDGGFIETSGLIGFQIVGAPDAASPQGEAGTWLIDPSNITVTNSRSNDTTAPDGAFVSNGTGDAEIHVVDITNALIGGADVIIRTQGESGTGNGDITFDKDGDLDYNNSSTRTLTLDAAGDIIFEAGSRIRDRTPGNNSSNPDRLNVVLLADGAVTLEGAVGGEAAASITTQGGQFTVGSEIDPVASFTNNGTITTTGAQNQAGGDIAIHTTGTLTSTRLTANGGTAGSNSTGQAAGSITLNAGTGITLIGPVTATGGDGQDQNNNSGGQDGGAGGVVLITSAIGAIDIQAGIDVSGGNSDGDNGDDPASGGDAGSVRIQADSGVIHVSMITANGGNSAGNDSDNSRHAGNGGALTISGNGITLNNNLFSIGGVDSESNAGNGATITLNGPVTLAKNITLDTRGATRGDIDFNGMLDGTTARAEDLALYGSGISFSDLAGSETRLGDLLIDATGMIDAGTYSITTGSLDVQNSNRFTSGAINTAGNTTGGNVTINSSDITVGAINTSATDIGGVGGAITLSATDNSSGGTPDITLNGDINASGTTEGAVAISLNGSDSPTGSVTLNAVTDFTSAITLTGSTGTDTLTAANRPNNWVLSTTDSVLNDNFIFTGIETLTGNAQTDRFILPDSGEFSGTLYGGGGVDEIQAGNQLNTWSVSGDGIGSVTGLSATFNEIERLTGNSNTDDFTLLAAGSISDTIDGGGGTNTLTGRDSNTTWTISTAGNSLAATSSGNDYVNAFINIDTLTGGTGSDIFDLGAGISGSVNGGQGDDTFNIDTPGLSLTDLRGGAGSDTLNGNDSANIWTINAANSGTLFNGGQTVTFAAIENLNGAANNDDTFNFTVTPTDGNVAIDGRGQLTQDNVNLAGLNGALSVQLGATGFNNIESITGNNNSTLIGTDAGETWNLTGENDGTVGTLIFVDFNNLTGGSGNDTFNFGADVTGTVGGGAGNDTFNLTANATGIINGNAGNDTFNINAPGITLTDLRGGAGSDTLNGNDSANTWTINAANSGTLVNGGQTVTFAAIENLNGAANNDDTFNFTVTPTDGNVAIDGRGQLTQDNVNLAGLNGALSVQLGATGFNNIESITGNNNSTLIGTDAGETWNLTGENDGNVGTLTFIDFNNLTGGSGNDTFIFQARGSLSDLLDGGAGIDDRVDLSALAAVDVTLGQGLANIESILGNNSNSTLRGTVGNNTFILTGENDGNLGSLAFENFSDLDGGDGDDTFIFQPDGSLSGQLDGGAGIDDRVDLSALAVVDVTPGQGQVNIEQIIGNGNDSTLRGTAAANVFVLSGENDGSLDGLNFTDFNQLNGGDGNDTFTFRASGRLSGLLDGGAGSDRVDLSLVTGALRVTQGEDIRNIEILNGNNNATLIGTTAANVFILSGENTGTLDELAFTNFSQLNGGDGNDTFTFEANGQLTDLLDGGAGSDRVDLSRVTRALRITQGEDIANIETLTGNNNATLIGTTAANVFTLSGENSGTLDNTLTFTTINQLNGGDGDDRFTFGANGQLTGLLEGGAGSDRVDLSLVSGALRVTQGDDINNIETLIGNNNSTLIGTATANTFILSGENAGTLDSALTFSNISQLNGGDGDDSFTFGANGQLTGLLEGGAGSDRVDLSQVTGALRVTQGDDISNIETLIGNNNAILIGTPATNVFILSGENSGTLDNSLAFTDFNQLNGGDGDDTFTFQTSDSLSDLLDGGAGSDHVDMTALAEVDLTLGQDVVNIEQLTGNRTDSTLRGENNANTWTLSGENAGTVDGVAFSGFTTLRGGNSDDRFTQGGFSGAIYGGAHDTGDTIDYSNQQTVNVTVGNALAGDASIIAEIEGIRGNGSNSTLTGSADNRDWIITGENDGRIGTLAFEDFNNLIGSDVDDTFTFEAASSLTGRLDGGGGSDRVNLSALAVVDIRLGQDVVNIERITGNNTASTLRGEDTVNNWTITGVNAGGISADGGPTLAFIGFNDLHGGSNNDRFIINGTGALNGRITAGAGDDSLDITLAGAQSGQTAFSGGAGTDRIELSGGGSAYQETVTSTDDGGAFTFTDATSGANGKDYRIEYTGVESLQDNVTADMRVYGSATNDLFQLGANNFTINAATAVNYTNKTGLAIIGQGGEADRIILTGDLAIAGGVTLSAEQIINDSGSRITAGGLTLEGVTAAGTADAKLLTAIDNLTLSDAGAVYLDEQNSLTITQMTAVGAIDINAGGSVNSLGGLISDNRLTIASNSDIDLGQANQLSGPLTLTAVSGSVTLANATGINLAAVSANTLSLTTATGSITGSGIISIAANTDLNAAGDITLTGDNDFSTITATATNVTLRDVNVIEQVDINATGSVDIAAQTGLGIGSIAANDIQLDAGEQGQLSDTNGSDVNLSGTRVTLRAGTGIGTTDALETQTAELDVINRTGSVAITNTGAVTLSNLVTRGDIHFTNNGNVTLDTIDTGYNHGRLAMTVTGSVLGVNRDYREQPDITANNALINVSGDIGTLYRPVSVRVNNEFVLFSNVGSVYYYGGRPRTIIDNSTIKIGLFDALLGLSGQQLIDVETLSEIDPAIFTEVRHYTQDEISIRLPADQRYDRDEEDERLERRERSH
ncbi:MAG: filamentous hemagglutinin N-terminal domain-containing protein [Gammaproteobacteria bacterium]|nr:filamentous hemagglutinin N-terminal domain-containing protein [Gammaproteobacteria bacterium]MCF6363003.1 filamentous hemagglutinin N-terminal domain-containing protein [Gammaproteobacteria bacterium]